MKGVVLKVKDDPIFEKTIEILGTYGFDDLTVLEEYNIVEEDETVKRFLELQKEYPFVLVFPPLEQSAIDKILKGLEEQAHA